MQFIIEEYRYDIDNEKSVWYCEILIKFWKLRDNKENYESLSYRN